MKNLVFARAWRHGLSHPIYVAQDLQDVQVLLSEGRVSAAFDALWRRATLGSDAAAALLGYLNLRHVVSDGIESSQVAQRCVEAANRDAGFALYVVAWQAYEKGEYRMFAKSLQRSARQHFLPAIADIARAAMQTTPTTIANRRIAKKSFWVAFKRGHVLSALYFFHGCVIGQFGFHFRLLGLAGFPLSIIVLVPIMKLFPFSIRYFHIQWVQKNPCSIDERDFPRITQSKTQSC